jgi:cupin 2 domain-containing protein
MRGGNLYAEIPRVLAAELVEPLVETNDLRLERIVSTGHTTPAGEWYDQQRDEWVLLAKGRARLRFETPDETLDLRAGDYVLIPAHRRHRVEETDPAEATVWLALHF